MTPFHSNVQSTLHPCFGRPNLPSARRRQKDLLSEKQHSLRFQLPSPSIQPLCCSEALMDLQRQTEINTTCERSTLHGSRGQADQLLKTKSVHVLALGPSFSMRQAGAYIHVCDSPTDTLLAVRCETSPSSKHVLACGPPCSHAAGPFATPLLFRFQIWESGCPLPSICQSSSYTNQRWRSVS